MAAYNKFYDFVDQLGRGNHQFGTHVFKVMLSNTAPSPTNSVKADIVEISAGNGYSAGGADAQVTWSETSGTAKAQGTKVTWTATGGSIGPFRYVVLYNSSTADGKLVCWWDYGSSITLNDGESFSVKFNGSDTTGDIFTLS